MDMFSSRKHFHGNMLQLFIFGSMISPLLAGCGHKPSASESTAGDAGATATAGPAGPVDPRLEQSFADATVDPPPEWHRPPDMTMTQKSVGKIYTDVVRLWDAIRFVSPSGRRLAYRATLDTELGPIEITLLPEVAPNHVRSFVALSRAGYYDGLVFDRTIHQD